jgi:hypothetical protein
MFIIFPSLSIFFSFLSSYHIQKFMRTTTTKPAKINNTLPLQLVKRGTDVRSFMTETPQLKQTLQYWNLTLAPYLTHLDEILTKLKPLAQQAASANAELYKGKTVIVMVCNFGQSELLTNFVCHAQARGLDVKNVIVFATDVETQQLSEGLGLATFYDQQVRTHTCIEKCLLLPDFGNPFWSTYVLLRVPSLFWISFPLRMTTIIFR